MVRAPPGSQGTLSHLFRQPGQKLDPVASSDSQKSDRLPLSSGTLGSGHFVLPSPVLSSAVLHIVLGKSGPDTLEKGWQHGTAF